MKILITCLNPNCIFSTSMKFPDVSEFPLRFQTLKFKLRSDPKKGNMHSQTWLKLQGTTKVFITRGRAEN